ncbi:exonuclease 1-like [Orbicella faveolata]|uniref:exonuclease 1-like n=1 Tax=Orbicella faveolata TaxID=48498 RepID=UPI0009E3B44D|nr:exonuclease 1-like [Orbicella faveolata]
MPTLIVPESYFEKFFLADSTFQHQSVFDPLSRKVVPLSGDDSNVFFLSRSNERPTDGFATDIAIGNINVQTGAKVRDFPLPSAETEMLSLTTVANRETEEDPTELPTAPNPPSATVLAEVVSVEQGDISVDCSMFTGTVRGERQN